MNKTFYFICVLIFVLFPNTVFAQTFTKEEVIEVLNKANPVVEYARIINDCTLFEDANETSKTVCEIYKDSEVEILEDKTTIWYRVRSVLTDEIGWLKREHLEIPDTTKALKTQMTKEDLEKYAKIINFESDTKFFVWVDLKRQLVHILEKEKGSFQLKKVIPCSSGKSESPTLKGFFKIQERGVWFYSERLKSGAKFWVRFCGSYLFHSIPMDKSKNIIDETIGERGSSGCIRMSVPDAEWFYNNIPDGTSVFIQ